MASRGCKPKFGPWYVCKGTREDGSVEFIEAVNGGPFRTIEGARKSLTYQLDWYVKIEVIELGVKRIVATL